MKQIDISTWGMFIIGDLMNKLDLKIKKRILIKE